MSGEAPPAPLAAMPREFWIIAYLTLGIFAAIMLIILIGCLLLLKDGISPQNAAALAAVAGLVGAIAGYAASNVSTILSAIFGGSLTGQHPQRTVNATSAMTINEAPPVVQSTPPTTEGSP